MRHGSPHHLEGSHGVYGVEIVPIIGGDAVEVVVGHEHRGASRIHEYIEATKCLDSLVDHAPTIGIFGNVALQRDALDTERRDLGGRLLSCIFRAAVIHGHITALGSESERCRTTHTRSSAGDECCFSVDVHALDASR